MGADVTPNMARREDQIEALKKLREPFPPNQISMLPKPTKAQTDAIKQDFKQGIRCDICGGWHHPKVVHLAYVGHAALTDRFLDVDPLWSWEPLAFDESGLPAIDKDGGLWIRLTVLGMTRIGYGDAPGKIGGDAMKERIGDALRNAGIRFGAALDLWHKGDLHAHENGEADDGEGAIETPGIDKIAAAQSIEELQEVFGKLAGENKTNRSALRAIVAAKDVRKKELSNGTGN